MSTTEGPAGSTTDYLLAPTLAARFVGAYLVLLAVVLLATTAAAAGFDLNPDLLVLVLGVGVLGLIGLAWRLRRLVVVQLTDAGYRVRGVRAVGTPEARWSEVEDAVAMSPRGIECLVLRLRDGRSSTIPVQMVAVDKDDLARDVRDRLERAGR